MMRKLYISLILLLLMVGGACRLVPPTQKDTSASIRVTTNIKWDPVCRHDALYWVSMLGEEYETRMAFGSWKGLTHVQPQIKLESTWYFFKVKDDKVILISLDPAYWELYYYLTFLEFADLHNNWMRNYRPDKAINWKKK